MRSLSKIKESVDHKTTPQSPLNTSVIVSPAQVRSEKYDPELAEKKSLIIQNRRIKDILFAKRKEIEKLNDTILKKTSDAITTGDDIIAAAKKRAESIINEAEAVKKKVEASRQKAQQQQKTLDENKRLLEASNSSVDTRTKALDSREAAIRPKEEELAKMHADVAAKVKESNELLHTISLLFLATLKRCEAVSTIDDGLLDILSQNIAKADKMYLEALQVDAQNVANKKLNEARSDELDTKEKWLLDRESSIQRAANEVKRK